MDEQSTTPEVEVKDTEVTEEAVVTIADVMEEKERDDRVPLKTLLEVKKEKKALERELSDIKASISKGATKAEVSSDLKSLAEKYDVDSNFLEELTTIVYSKAKAEAEIAIKPVLEKADKEKLDKTLTEHIEKALEDMPEYESVVNKDVIKSLAKLPENKNKTFQQIIEDTYSNTVTGKRTMETSTPRGGKETDIDWSKANNPEYFSKIMADPNLKKKYNESLTSRINL